MSQSSPFLALTALEDFWDTSRPMLYLGDWCRLHSRRSFWESLEGEVIATPWEDARKLLAAQDYIDGLVERVLPALAESLNCMHRLSRSERYWRILLGPWLLLYLPAVYDRYVTLRTALDLYPDFVTHGLGEECFSTPRDTLDFVYLLQGDPYNLQLYSRILTTLGKDFVRKKVVAKEMHFSGGNTATGMGSLLARWRKSIFRLVVRIAARACKKGRLIVLRSSNFPNAAELELISHSGGKVLPFLGDSFTPPFQFPDYEKREGLAALLSSSDDFELVLRAMLPHDIPQSFVESFDAVTVAAERAYPVTPKAIFSSVAWYYDESFKQWAAGCAESGTLLIGTQHGGVYGIRTRMPFEDHETSIVDRYYTWGWERSGRHARTIPFPSTKLAGRKVIGGDNRREGILYATTSRQRYLIQFPYTPAQFVQYLGWQVRFLRSVPARLMSKLRVRPHLSDYDWNITQRLHEECPGLAIEGWDIPFLESLNNSRIYVCDHQETTFAEALSADKPTILFWDPGSNPVRKEAQPYYESLHSTGILYYSPESAAEALISAYEDVEAWWNRADRQASRRAFCDQFVKTSPDAVNKWAGEFNRIAREKIVRAPSVELAG